MTGEIKMVDMSASLALTRYAGIEALRGKTMAETMKKVMRFWVDFAVKKVPKGDRGKIMRELSQVVTSYSKISSSMTGVSTNLKTRKTKRAAHVDRWKGTYASIIVAKLNYNKAKGSGWDHFYKSVALFVRRRLFASNLHRSGFRPAFMRLRGKMSSLGRDPKMRSDAGGYIDSVKERVVEILVENWASAREDWEPGVPKKHKPDGISKLAPNAFNEALVQVEAMLTDFFYKDVKKLAKEVGFDVS